ncbi:DASH family cryptochrome [Leeuwenhoekiella marinoflava]|uniref:Cryptochrome DASH n=2 Tax=Leeuwenhoekiella marinoflava TaxID=988 RepID=A0A4Q0PK83_9FLAO|nr:DASH family cryptochrome [Leeuwenhoekiella marinoflava]RXG26866.1 deoxyribodipyrimidine photo-lyase (single-stranded DNA-specific) [Leeuwenhoekiella marinoflava]SHF39694.1 deoxyribodipyrimidine photo-lyase (single-stranded DNA-specific) [Leeuwenhoekiella marinoflava DSM 3653]
MNLVWFRNDLRTQDNHSLNRALTDAESVVAVYCFDPKQFKKDRFGFKKTERFRAQFLIETIQELKNNLAEFNIPLFVFCKQPEEILPQLISDYNINKVFLQKEWTYEERKVSDSIKKHSKPGTEFIETFDQFLIHPEDLPYDRFADIPQVFTQWRKKCEKQASIRGLVKPRKLSEENLLDTQTTIPTLTDLRLKDFKRDNRSAFPFKGGENQALLRIRSYFWETKKLQVYKKTRNGLLGNDYSSKLSAWLANGSLSPRTVYWLVKEFEKNQVKNESTYWLIFELFWRDYFKYISLKHGDKIFYLGGILDKKYDWNQGKETRDAWISGTTKYDFVNANMQEIAATGWMSNRGRQNVASFWSKEMQQDWRIGAAYFESMLIDYDVHSNYGNWMYNSGVGNDPRDRKFNIKSQAERYDGDGKYRRTWLQKSLFD